MFNISSRSGADGWRRQNSTRKRALIRKRFVNARMLVLVLSVCVCFLIFTIPWIKHLPLYLIILVELPLLLIVWHRAYLSLYDLKLLFFFNDDYDVKINYPPNKKLPCITFIIPSFHEPFSVGKMTFDSVVNTPYAGKKEIIVVDNSKNVLTVIFVRGTPMLKIVIQLIQI